MTDATRPPLTLSRLRIVDDGFGLATFRTGPDETAAMLDVGFELLAGSRVVIDRARWSDGSDALRAVAQRQDEVETAIWTGCETLIEEAASVEKARPFLPGLDFSEAEWMRILNAHPNQPSERRQMFGETAVFQADVLAGGVYDDDPCETSRALARRIDGLALPFRLAILAVIEAFWMERAPATFATFMEGMGVTLCETAHQRLAAEAFRARAMQGTG